MITYDLSEDTIREFLEILVSETEQNRIIWEMVRIQDVPAIPGGIGIGPISVLKANIDEDNEIFLIYNTNTSNFILKRSDLSAQVYVLKEAESKTIFQNLYKIADFQMGNKNETNRFILDFIRVKKPVPQIINMKKPRFIKLKQTNKKI